MNSISKEFARTLEILISFKEGGELFVSFSPPFRLSFETDRSALQKALKDSDLSEREFRKAANQIKGALLAILSDDVEIGATYPTGGDPDPDLAGPRPRRGYVLEYEGSAGHGGRLLQAHGLHNSNGLLVDLEHQVCGVEAVAGVEVLGAGGAGHQQVLQRPEDNVVTRLGEGLLH